MCPTCHPGNILDSLCSLSSHPLTTLPAIPGTIEAVTHPCVVEPPRSDSTRSTALPGSHDPRPQRSVLRTPYLLWQKRGLGAVSSRQSPGGPSGARGSPTRDDWSGKTSPGAQNVGEWVEEEHEAVSATSRTDTGTWARETLNPETCW